MKKFFLVFLFLFPLHAGAVKYHEPSASEADTAVRTFKYLGEWIHPLVVHEFLPWSSDHALPLVTAVDVGAATDSNRYFGAIKAGSNNRVEAEASEGTKKSYEYIGRLKNGAHVVVTTESGRGSMVPTHLAVLRLGTQSATNGEGKKYRRLDLSVERIVTLGDRAFPTVTLKGNAITVKIVYNTPQNPKTIELKID